MELAVDTLLLHQGVVPHVNLAMATGCRHEWDRTQLCWRPVVDAWGASSVVGVSVAGDGAGIEGAEAAEHAGRLAALDAAHRLDVLSRDRRDQIAQEFWAKRRLATVGRGFLDRWFRPHPEFRVPDDATIVCRCEEVTAGQIRDSVRLGCPGPNQMKAYLRCGMGPCQGRLCGLTVTEIMAEARGVSPTEVGYYRLRAPMKPVPLRDLAAWPKSAAGPAIPR
jgi:NADPH-dependent 2,4-dienoyl-CoA reductase/sulfur reductase-like enzyme